MDHHLRSEFVFINFIYDGYNYRLSLSSMA